MKGNSGPWFRVLRFLRESDSLLWGFPWLLQDDEVKEGST